MIEVCPRCSSRLGQPLKSGRQVCPTCGWASESLPQRPAKPPKPPPHPVVELLQTGMRLVGKALTYAWKWLQTRLQGLTGKGDRPGLMRNLNSRLSQLEESIPASVAEHPRPWMMPEEAFFHLGGDPEDQHSTVQTLDGTRAITLRRFLSLETAADFHPFGLEADLDRRLSQRPWLRQHLTSAS